MHEGMTMAGSTTEPMRYIGGGGTVEAIHYDGSVESIKAIRAWMTSQPRFVINPVQSEGMPLDPGDYVVLTEAGFLSYEGDVFTDIWYRSDG